MMLRLHPSLMPQIRARKPIPVLSGLMLQRCLMPQEHRARRSEPVHRPAHMCGGVSAQHCAKN